MMIIIDEQRRLRARIADFELRIAEVRENGEENRLISNAERDQMLQMLVRTLKALKARQVTRCNC
jgi:hypothetical protein